MSGNVEKEADMISMKSIVRTTTAIAAAAMLLPLAACGGGSQSGAVSDKIPAKGTDDGAQITLWTRSPLERQAKNVVGVYNKSHKN